MTRHDRSGPGRPGREAGANTNGETQMPILKCECYNSTADSIYGVGWRPHTRLATRPEKPLRQQECMCEACYFVRTIARGLDNGSKH